VEGPEAWPSLVGDCKGQSSEEKIPKERGVRKMPNDEIEIMRDAFCFLRDHNDPSANDSGRLVVF